MKKPDSRSPSERIPKEKMRTIISIFSRKMVGRVSGLTSESEIAMIRASGGTHQSLSIPNRVASCFSMWNL